MKDRGYLVVAGLIAALIAVDIGYNDSKVVIYLVRDLIGLVEYIKFWD